FAPPKRAGPSGRDASRCGHRASEIIFAPALSSLFFPLTFSLVPVLRAEGRGEGFLRQPVVNHLNSSPRCANAHPSAFQHHIRVRERAAGYQKSYRKESFSSAPLC